MTKEKQPKIKKRLKLKEGTAQVLGEKVGKAPIVTFADLVKDRDKVAYKTAYCRLTYGKKADTMKPYIAAITPPHMRPDMVLEPGSHYYNFTVMEPLKPNKFGEARYLIRCDCGREKSVLKKNIYQGKTRSCGMCGYKKDDPRIKDKPRKKKKKKFRGSAVKIEDADS